MRLILVNLSVVLCSVAVAVVGPAWRDHFSIDNIVFIEQAQSSSDKKYHSAKLKVENRTLLEMIKIYGRGKGAWNSSSLRCTLTLSNWLVNHTF